MNILISSYLRFIFISILAFLVTGCGSTWQHSYKNENAFYADKNFCSDKANKAFPRARTQRASALEIAQLEPGRVGVYNAALSGAMIADSIGSMAREKMADNCMKSKGWYLTPNK